MSPVGSNGARQMASLLRSHSKLDSAVCRNCQETLTRRGFATASAASSTTVSTETTNPSLPPDVQPSEPTTASNFPYTIKAGVVLSRAPRITRDLTSFEKSFYFYQRRLNERLALPFTRYFYFKRGTPADLEWRRKYKDRETPSRDIGKYNAYSKDAWHDELLVGAVESEPSHQVEALVRDAEGYSSLDAEGEDAKVEEVPRPLSRITEADKLGDEKSLDRALQRTLYLLVKVKQGYWKFPSVTLVGKENLRTAAERGLHQSVGPDMNTWMIGYHPVGHFVQTFAKPIKSEAGTQLLGEKTFFLKGRILAGQADIQNDSDITDFKWLAKDEIEKHVIHPYWSSVKNMLAER
ncbi:54S ribosomal protein L17 mitochondrial [Myotisia sp. PD_48]|nr:54S ribosomal protein L17 mitochondrial [Myotisia sp. PD_48]